MTAKSHPIIEIKGFKKSYGSKTVHHNINFEVYKGECVGLLGGSGAGKSVILRSLIGLEKPDQGEVYVNGQEISRHHEKQLVDLRKRVAYVFQSGALFDSMSVFENLAYPLKEHTTLTPKEISEKIHSQLVDFGLAGNEALYPASLSGGMQKRLGLARAIILDPEVVLYDEPTAGLDPYNTRKIQEMILALKKRQVTSILVTHDMATALEVCDRLAIIKDGEIIATGTPGAVKEDEHHPLNHFISGDEH